MRRPPGTGSTPDINVLLAAEGARVEWKENVADVGGVVRTLSAFANDHGNEGGGWVICGIEEQRDEYGFPRPYPIGLLASQCKELREKVVDWCHRYVEPSLTPKVEEMPVPGHPERRLLVFSMAASQRVHWIKDKKMGTRVWYRTDSQTREAPSDVIAALMRNKGESPPFLEEACPGASVADLDSMLLDEALRPFELPRPVSDYLVAGVNVAARTPPLVVQDSSSEDAVPTRLAVLLGCREPARFLRGAIAILAVYEGISKTDRHSRRFDLGGPLPRLIRDVIERLQTHIGYDVDKSASVAEGEQNRPRYARRAIEEAVVNAFVHRDYAAPDPVRIDVFADRIEIWSPGGLMRGLDEAHLAEGRLLPSWRNGSLASFMFRLGLAQELGQGLTTIVEESRKITGKRPKLRNEAGWFGVVLPASSSLLPASPRSFPVFTSAAGRQGVFLISIGGPSIRPMAEHAFAEAGLSPEDVLVDFATGYIEPAAPQWLEQAAQIRDHISAWIENPAYGTFHLFYRGPVVMAPLIGALVAPIKPLVMYHFEDGRYFAAFTLDRRFLRGALPSPGSA